MADSIRQQIINAIDTRMKAILQIGGYETDIGQNVCDWKPEALQESDLPALIYRDVMNETEILNLNMFVHRMTVEILAAVTSSTPMATIRKILADIDKAIGTDMTWGGLAILSERVSDESGVEIQDQKFAGCTTTLVITYRTQAWNDYSQI